MCGRANINFVFIIDPFLPFDAHIRSDPMPSRYWFLRDFSHGAMGVLFWDLGPYLVRVLWKISCTSWVVSHECFIDTRPPAALAQHVLWILSYNIIKIPSVTVNFGTMLSNFVVEWWLDRITPYRTPTVNAECKFISIQFTQLTINPNIALLVTRKVNSERKC